MKLIITEKNIAAQKIADILATKKATKDKVYNTPIYTFEHKGEDYVAVGLKGHILEVVFPEELQYKKKAWTANFEDGTSDTAPLPSSLPTPPWSRATKVFPKGGVVLKSWNLKALPYLIWAPIGKQPAEKEIARALRTLAKRATEIIIATDFDREGELIGSDARGVVQETNPTAPIYRARFSAITKDEINRAFSELTQVDDNLAQAGEARQDIDLIWGAVLTRYLSKVRFSGVGNPRSAGRVQTPTLKLIVDKEKERDAFVPEDYWVVSLLASSAEGVEIKARHVENHFKDEKSAQAAYNKLQAIKEAAAQSKDLNEKTALKVADIASKKKQRRAPAPFNTTSLQVAAAAEGFSPSRTMRIAESLYMNGYISYPRVDNTVYPKSLGLKEILGKLAQVDVYREHAQKLLAAPLKATRGDKESTDHPPIHPTAAADSGKLKAEEWKLYNLVARRFMATLSGDATVEETELILDAQGDRYRATGTVVVVPGYRAIYHYGQKKEVELPKLELGSFVALVEVEFEAKQTNPPARYSEGSIITKMEKEGLGTKATRADAIQKLINRSYIMLEDKSYKPSMLGINVIDALSAFAEQITSPQMTANLEAEMDQIALGKKDRKAVVDHSRLMLDGVMMLLLDKSEEVGELLAAAEEFDSKVGTCPKCSNDMMIKSSAKNKTRFVGCKSYPDCDNTYPLPDGKVDALDEQCASCGAPRVRIQQFRSKPVERCLNPDCETNFEPEIDLGPCPVCEREGRSAKIIGRRSGRTLKRFARCENYDICGVSFPLPGSGAIRALDEACDSCGFTMIEVSTRRGPWKICPNIDCPSKKEEKTQKSAVKKRTVKKK